MKEKANKASVKICSSLLFLLFSTTFWALAQAQIHSDATGDKESAHIKRGPDADAARFIVEQEIPTQMQLPEIQFNTCQASVTLQYHQRNTLARVEATVENESCATSRGEYNLLVNVVDDAGASRNLSFSETWEQKNGSGVTLSRDYPIGENVTLKRVMTQGIRCECMPTAGSE